MEVNSSTLPYRSPTPGLIVTDPHFAMQGSTAADASFLHGLHCDSESNEDLRKETLEDTSTPWLQLHRKVNYY